ncbi:Putative mitochondrial saccharopine dehydrogenase-like oxidoreductase [Glycine soja]|nr:Putative mitochondrial saccharopine dehydrogenase-like oxidoreductase [Glycine soja]
MTSREEVGFDGGAEGGGGEARGEVAGEGVPPEEGGGKAGEEEERGGVSVGEAEGVVGGSGDGAGGAPVEVGQCALVLLSQRDNLPKGGVYPPGIIFGPTDLQERLQQNGISFDVISESTISS